MDAVRQGLGGNAAQPNQPTETQKTELTPLNQQDYPNINYWYEEDYNEEVHARKALVIQNAESQRPHRGPRRANEGENVMCWYLEDHSGRTLTRREVKPIRETARRIWRVFYEQSSGTLASPWGKVNLDIQTRFYEEIESKFPILRLCHAHWKACKICTQGYSQWYSTHTKPKKSPKNEQVEATSSVVDLVRPAKRSIDDALPAPLNKRARGVSIICIYSPLNNVIQTTRALYHVLGVLPLPRCSRSESATTPQLQRQPPIPLLRSSTLLVLHTMHAMAAMKVHLPGRLNGWYVHIHSYCTPALTY
jgi:hypothetical protein